jgi:salicylate hydroxylase
MTNEIQDFADVPQEVDVAIIGAGIGGLAAALALRKAGLNAHVFEQTVQLKEVGGAVVIREPSVRLMETWGVAEQFHKEAVEIEMIEVCGNDGKHVRMVGTDQLGEGRTYSVHRADVHARLLSGVDASHLHLGLKSAEVFEDGDFGVVRFENGKQVKAKVLVGADGIKSVTRKFIHDDEMVFSKLVVMRGLAPSSAMPKDMPNDRMYSWGQPPRQMVLLPLRGGKEVAMDTIMTREVPPEDLWTSEVPVSELLDFFKGFDPALLELINAGTVPVRVNPVYEREPLDRWSTAHITLLGDAAHAMAPRMGQGANQAIQDADALARALSAGRLANVPDALRRYEQERAPITKKIQIASRTAPQVQSMTSGNV